MQRSLRLKRGISRSFVCQNLYDKADTGSHIWISPTSAREGAGLPHHHTNLPYSQNSESLARDWELDGITVKCPQRGLPAGGAGKPLPSALPGDAGVGGPPPFLL
jgi:hypothetical protein